MAGSGVSLYAVTAAGNKTVIGTIDWREDTYMPSQINDNIGQIMADIRAMANAIANGWIEIGDGEGVYTATYVSATSFRFDGVDVTAYYRAGMRVRVVAPTPGTLSGTITSSTFSTHTTLVVAWDSGSLSNEAITSVSLGVGSGDTTDPAVSISKSYRNILGRNGGFEVWQRGAGGAADFTVSPAVTLYTADGWSLSNGNPSGTSVRVAQSAGIAVGSRWAAVVQRPNGQSGTVSPIFEFPLDTDECVPLRAQIVTLSMTLVAGANWSPASGNISIALFVGTGAPARRGGVAYTSETIVISATQPLTTTATRYTFTSAAAVPSNITQASVVLSWTPVGPAGAADYFVIDDVQLEIGSVATPFERRPFESELAACSRHFRKTFAYGTAPATDVGANTGEFTFIAARAGAGVEIGHMRFDPPFRISPTATGFNPAAANNQIRDLLASVDCSSANLGVLTENGITPSCSGNAATVIGDHLGIHLVLDAGI